MTTYLTGDPAEYEQRMKERLVALGINEEKAAGIAARQRELAVQVASPYAANLIQCQRGS